MAKFFFNYRIGPAYVEDPEGTELSGLDAARLEAIHNARHLMSAAIERGADISGRIYEICGEDGDVLLLLPFVDALRFEE